MYRLAGPNLLIFIPMIAIGAIVTTIVPNYMGANRILSFSSLIIGEIGMSFIPVLAFFPKATLLQIATLACIYLLNTLVVCVATWGVYSIGLTNKFALLWADNSFHINTYALFVANIFSLGNLVLCFKLIYDEELAKEFQSKKKSIRHGTRFGLGGFKSPLLRRPSMGDIGGSGGGLPPPTPSSKQTTYNPPSQKKGEFLFDEEIEKPFQFEPDISEPLDTLPEESSGGLFHQEEDKGTGEASEFFDDEETEYQARKSDDILSSTTPKEPPPSSPPPQASQPESTHKPSSPATVLPPPTDIKNDLTIIFEQYSSLNAIKKLTSSVKQAKPGRKRDRKSKKPYVISDNIPEQSTHTEGDVHEATFRLVSEAEKISEVKDNLKRELNEEILNKVNERTSQLEASLGKTESLKDEILGSIRSVKDELLKSVKEEIESKLEEKKDKDIDTQKDEMTKELQAELLKKLDQKISQIEESTQKHSEKIEQIKDSLKDEIHNDLLSKIQEKTSQIEDSVGKTESLKEEILNSIKGVKDDLLSSLKNEIEDKFKEQSSEPESVTEEKSPDVQPLESTSEETPPTADINSPFQEPSQVNFEPILETLLKEPKVKGTQILDNEGQVLAQKWNEQFAIHETNSLQNLQFFNILNNEINQTNQGDMCHVLLESENETIVLAKLENKLLTVYTEGTGAIYYGQILRAISSLEENL